jgi:tetratricopeptide (TPR) repeat protein
MRGLILTNLNRKEEGLECVKKGVRMDLTSHICWHVFGLVHKADRNYEEALKCYTQALKFEKVCPFYCHFLPYLSRVLTKVSGQPEHSS